jgi:hypothetical protein
MAQTITIIEEPEMGMFSKLKLAVLNVANGAAETSVAVNWETYGINTVLLYDFTIRDTFTGATWIGFANLSGTTVTYTWTSADVANVLVWAIGQ